MASYIYNTNTGIVVPDTSTVKDEVKQEYKNALGQDLDTDTEGTPQARLIETETIARKASIENMALLANQINPDQATGRYLDAICKMFGVERAGATRTRVLCQLTGTPATTIPTNAQAQDTEGNIYYNESDITLDPTGNGQGYFIAQEAGAIECSANTLTTISTAILGWETINNATSGITGENEQTDNQLRYNLSLNVFDGQSLTLAIRSAIMKLDTVEDALVIDNPTSAADTTSITGITIPAHSLFICVDGGTNTDIANAIFSTKSGGCGYTTGTGHTQTVQVTDQYSGQQYNVSFDRPVFVPIEVEVTLATGQATAEIISQVKQAIIDYSKGNVYGVDGLIIGRNVSPFEIASAITQELPALYIKKVEVTKSGGSMSTSEIAIEKNERATIALEDISVS